MEDTYFYEERDGIVVSFVCDGHGSDRVSKETQRRLPAMLFSALRGLGIKTNIKMAEVVRAVIMAWGAQSFRLEGGSTLTGFAIKSGIVFVFNIGDSRTCARLRPNSFVYFLRPVFKGGTFTSDIFVDYSQQQYFSTVDHDVMNAAEARRIHEAGGKIRDDRLNNILAVTRALGDSDVGAGLTYAPDIFWFRVDALNGPIILYSDGAYEEERGQDHRHLYKLGETCGAGCVVDHAFRKGSEDNITVLIASFNGRRK